MTFSMCEWPVITNPGECSFISFRALGVYLPGYPPMCIIRVFKSSIVNSSNSLNLSLNSELSIFPYTALTGANFSSSEIDSILPISPACHISSTLEKNRTLMDVLFHECPIVIRSFSLSKLNCQA